MVWIEGIEEIEEDDFKMPEVPKKTEPEFHDGIIATYTAFRDQVYDAKSVLHPSCGFDASPAKVFQNVTFVDIEVGNKGAIEALKSRGLNALKMDVKDYTPEELHDLLILLNPQIRTASAIHAVKQGGFVLANDYHGNASEMWKKPSKYTPWGTIDFAERDGRKGDNRVVVSKDLEGLFEPVSDFEEMKRLRPFDYDFIRTAYPHLLQCQGIEPGKTLEETYRRHQRMMNASETLPAKRKGDFYIFVKK